MRHVYSRRSILAAVAGGVAFAGAANCVGAQLTGVGTDDTSSGEWESTRYGDIVTWDDSKMFIRENLSGPNQSGEREWDKVTLGLDPELTVALVTVWFEDLPFATLDELAAAYPQEYWSEELSPRFHPRGAKLTEDAYGFFYFEEDTKGLGTHYCGYHEFHPPAEPGGVWGRLELSTSVTFHEFDFDVMSANGEGVEINGNPTYVAWTFDEVLDAFAEEMDAAGV